MAAVAARDRVGLGWRPELAAGIFANLNRIDVLEVQADDYFDAPASQVRALRTLARQAPVYLHGIGMGLASTHAVQRKRVEAMARLIDAVQPCGWSEHLAFVRAGGMEIGHLAAPPRNSNTLEGLCVNVELARRVTGSTPALENIATLIDPPGSEMTEPDWIAAATRGADSDLLLDLHNVLTNATNFGGDPYSALARIPLDRVGVIHISGGRMLPSGRILDDHLHDTPDVVFDMLKWVAARGQRPLTVVLERDGDYPPIGALVAELDRARLAIAEGRCDRATL